MSAPIILRAADFAADCHRNQRRKDERASPYINHPLHVARLLSDVGGIDDAQVIVAGLLHDTVEDTDATPAQLAGLFGERVRDLVMEVSDDTQLVASERKRLQIDGAPRLSRDAVAIKLADKTSNIRDIIDSPPRGWSLDRRRRYLDWAQAVIDGCQAVNPALEKLFRATLAEARGVLKQLEEAPGAHREP
jgi:guanosine-3',5'-bis(diphosphate) 3'-pyrophosphohydrolase